MSKIFIKDFTKHAGTLGLVITSRVIGITVGYKKPEGNGSIVLFHLHHEKDIVSINWQISGRNSYVNIPADRFMDMTKKDVKQIVDDVQQLKDEYKNLIRGFGDMEHIVRNNVAGVLNTTLNGDL